MLQRAITRLHRPENVALLSDLLWLVGPLFGRTCLNPPLTLELVLLFSFCPSPSYFLLLFSAFVQRHLYIITVSRLSCFVAHTRTFSYLTLHWRGPRINDCDLGHVELLSDDDDYARLCYTLSKTYETNCHCSYRVGNRGEYMCMYVCLCVRLSVCVYASVFVYVYLSVCRSLYLFVCLGQGSAGQSGSVCLSLSLCLYVCLCM